MDIEKVKGTLIKVKKKRKHVAISCHCTEYASAAQRLIHAGDQQLSIQVFTKAEGGGIVFT